MDRQTTAVMGIWALFLLLAAPASASFFGNTFTGTVSTGEGRPGAPVSRAWIGARAR